MFYLVHAGTSLQVLRDTGAIYITLTPPPGVTISNTRRARFATLARRVIITNAPSENLWLDPLDFTLHRLALGDIGAPTKPSAPVAAVGGSTGLTGAYKAWVSYVHKGTGGEVLNQGPLSDPSNIVTLANQSLALSAIAVSTNPDVNCRRLYRTVTGGTEPLFWADIDDNTTTTFDDGTADAGLGDAAPDLGFAPAGTTPGTYMELITEWRSRIWGRANVDHIVYSEVEFPWAWPSANDLPAQSLGEDETGITGFIRRRDELGVGKRNRIMRVVGNTNEDFQVIIVSEETGILASESVLVIRDEGYFQGIDGVYKFGPDGVTPLSRDKVDPWFLEDDPARGAQFNRSLFSQAVGGYNPQDDSYDLHLPALSSIVLDRWVSYLLKDRRWMGPHKTTAFTPTLRALFRDAGAAFLPIIGGADGYIYLMNRIPPNDYPGAAPSVAASIAINWISNFLNNGSPDQTHVWGQPTFHLKAQSAGDITLTPRLGSLTAVDGVTRLLSMLKSRERLAVWGTGQLFRLQLTHDVVDQDVELYLWEQPVSTIGRR